MKKISIIILTASLFSLTSCGIYGTFDKNEMASVREDAYGNDYTAEEGDTLGLATMQWREIFTDPKLQTLIETGLENNTDLRIASLQCEEALASLKGARLAYAPSIDVSAKGDVNGSFETGKPQWGWQIPVNASWQIDIFGSLRNAKRKAAAMMEQSESYRQAVRSQIISTIAATYYSLVILDAQYEIYKETEATWKESVETTRRLMEAGSYTMAAVSQAEANYYSVCVSLVDIQKTIAETERTMCSLLGTPSRSIERSSLKDWKEPENISAGIPLYAIANRPDIKAAASSYEAAFYNTNMARSAMYPSITITGTANFPDLLYSAAASLLQPIFNRGALRTQLKIAKYQQEESALTFNQAVIDAGIEVNNLMTSYNTAKEKGELLDKQESALEMAVKSTTLLMENGPTTYLEILTAQTSLLNAQIQAVTNKLDEINSVISLYQALGGGQE